MSKLVEYREAERRLKEQLAALEAMKGDSNLQREIEFEQKLKTLMDEYGATLGKVISILDPQAAQRSTAARSTSSTQTRKPRQIKVYKNPHSGETIETKGGNHKQLKEWKNEYGADVVEGWSKAE